MDAAHVARLTRNMEYHQSLADYYKKLDEPEKKETSPTAEEKPPSPPRRATTGHEPPAENAPPAKAQPSLKERQAEQHKKLAELHADVAKQLQDLLATNIIVAPPKQGPIMRPTRAVRMAPAPRAVMH